MRILVVCGAGASSTFVAQRINSAARARDLAHVAVATNESSLADDLGTCDLLLVGPHLAPQLDHIRALATPRGVAVLLMDADAFADLDGTRLVDRIEAAVHDRSAPRPPATTH